MTPNRCLTESKVHIPKDIVVMLLLVFGFVILIAADCSRATPPPLPPIVLTPTSSPTITNTPWPTEIPTETPLAVIVPTMDREHTPTARPTNTPWPTATETVVPTKSPTPTAAKPAVLPRAGGERDDR